MLLIVDNYDSFTYNLYQYMTPLKKDICVVRNDRLSIQHIQQMQPTGIILSPGPGRPEHAGICIELIQAFTSIPILGVCLGHQAIVSALGGKIVSAPEIIHGKEEPIFHRNTLLYQHLPQPFMAGRYHSLLAERNSLPQALVVDAETSKGLIMGVHHRSRPLFGVQYHPESILTPQGPNLLKNFARLCLEASV